MVSLIIAVILATTAPAAGEKNPFSQFDDILIGSDSSGSVWTIRASNFARKTADGMEGWIKVDRQKDNTTKASSAMINFIVTCKRRIFGVQSDTEYLANGQMLSRIVNRYAYSAEPAVPGSMGDAVVIAVCDQG